MAGFVKEHYVADYNQQVLEEIEKKAQQTGKNGKGASSAADPEPNDEELEGDELLPAAVEVVLETGQASVSMLQRRLKLGYARAAPSRALSPGPFSSPKKNGQPETARQPRRSPPSTRTYRTSCCDLLPPPGRKIWRRFF